MLPLVKKALEKETDPEIKALLELIARRRAAEERRQGRRASPRSSTLGESTSPNSKTLLCAKRRATPTRTSASRRRRACARSKAGSPGASAPGLLFAGISLGSILLLAALGLAITYGLMGVINMAHGELIMIGAYTTYVVQNLFRELPGAFDWYLLAAVPAGLRRLGRGRHGCSSAR